MSMHLLKGGAAHPVTTRLERYRCMDPCTMHSSLHCTAMLWTAVMAQETSLETGITVAATVTNFPSQSFTRYLT